MKYLQKTDPALAKLVAEETKRQQETIDLIASENYCSVAVREALGSPLTNKYSEGYPGKRYYGGCAVVDAVEVLAQKRAKKVFDLGDEWAVNVQPYSGSPANMAVYFALMRPGEKVLGLNLFFGGHLTHGAKANFSSKIFQSVQYTVNRDGYIDYDEVRKLAHKEKPKMIIAGITAYSRIIDFKVFSDIAREVNAYLLADIAHIAGLIASGAHPSPFPYADVVTTTTHKTLRGPRGGLIFSRSDVLIKAGNKEISLSSAIDKAVFPGLQGGPHNNQTAAIAACLGEALKPAFKAYGKQIVKNASVLANELQKLGFTIVSGGTDNHLMLVDLTNLGISGKEAQDRLEKIGIVTNRNTVPYDTRSPFDPSGIRLGTPAVTTRGMKEKEMRDIARAISEALIKNTPASARNTVRALCKKFTL